jgi:hypothetical protein
MRSPITLQIVLISSLLSSCGSSDATKCGTACSSVMTCQGLQDRFYAALPAAQSCEANVPGQCQKTVATLSIGCPSPACLVAVNDDSALSPIESAWSQLGCGQLSGYGCVQGCRVAKTGLCIAADGGSACDPNP